MKRFKWFSALLVLGVCCAGQTASAVSIAISTNGTAVDNQGLVDFLNDSFTNITSINVGNYADPTTLPLGTEVAIVPRGASSGSYNNAVNSAAWDALPISVVSLNAYVTRINDDRWHWFAGGQGLGSSDAGDETTVTAAGASVLGLPAGTADFYIDGHRSAEGDPSINALGNGSLGTGTVLASHPSSQTVAATWGVGDTFSDGDFAGGPRLAFFVSDPSVGNPNDPRDSLTATGLGALVSALEATTPLTAIPEPSSVAILALGLVSLACYNRRRNS